MQDVNPQVLGLYKPGQHVGLSKLEAVCAVLRPISNVPSHWRALEGEIA